MRLGWSGVEPTVHRLARDLVAAGADALTLHPRWRGDGLGRPARWGEIARLKAEATVPVIGNGDIGTPGDVFRMLEETGCDGVMIGRAALARPWIFSQVAALGRGEPLPEPGREGVRRLLLEHSRRLEEARGPREALHRIRGYAAWYTRGLIGGTGLRRELNRAEDRRRFEEIVAAFFGSAGARRAPGPSPPPED